MLGNSMKKQFYERLFANLGRNLDKARAKILEGQLNINVSAGIRGHIYLKVGDIIADTHKDIQRRADVR